MAKLTVKDEAKLIADWKTGRFSQRDLASKYNCSKGKVSQLTNGIEKNQNGHLVDAQIAILSAKSLLSDEEMTAITNTAQNEAFSKGLIYNATQMNLIRTMEYLNKNQKLEKINVGDGVQNFEPVGLGADDFKQCQDTIDKASLTLGINQRHSSQNISVNTQTNVQANINQLSDEELALEAEKFGIVYKK